MTYLALFIRVDTASAGVRRWCKCRSARCGSRRDAAALPSANAPDRVLGDIRAGHAASGRGWDRNTAATSGKEITFRGCRR